MLGRLPRTSALIALGALGAHQLRYAIAYGGDASHELTAQGHGYLAHILPVLGAFALAAILAGLAGAALGRRPATGVEGFARRAVAFGAAAFLVYAGQELAEGALFAGHPAGAAAVFGAGGWLALPLCGIAGALCALLDRGLVRLEGAVAALAAMSRVPRAPARTRRPRPTPDPDSGSPLALGIAVRPPPLPTR
jgi:hypothetical protein